MNTPFSDELSFMNILCLSCLSTSKENYAFILPLLITYTLIFSINERINNLKKNENERKECVVKIPYYSPCIIMFLDMKKISIFLTSEVKILQSKPFKSWPTSQVESNLIHLHHPLHVGLQQGSCLQGCNSFICIVEANK